MGPGRNAGLAVANENCCDDLERDRVIMVREMNEQTAMNASMRTTNLELIVGVFLAIGVSCLAYLSIKIARKDPFETGGYPVQAMFTDCTGLRNGSPVLIAGVEIGRVKRISLQEYEAKVQMVINPGVVLQTDTIASIKTKGLIGERHHRATPGAADEKIPPGGTIRDTEPALDFERLISKFVHGNLTRPSDTPPPVK